MAKKIAGALAALAVVFALARGEALLPGNLTEIGEEAFAGDGTLVSVVVPESVREIGAMAFADCGSLRRIEIPQEVGTIAGDALPEVNAPLLVVTQPGSEAMRLAQGLGIDYQAGTVYRALVVNNSAYVGLEELPGTATDAEAVASTLALWPGTPYQVVRASDLTAQQLFSAIQSAFAGANEQDVSLLYFSGHGGESSDQALNGALMGVDGTYTTAAALRECLDGIPGRKVVVVDACFSGALIGKASSKDGNTVDSSYLQGVFPGSFISAFSWTRRTRGAGNLAESAYYVLAAAHSSEFSYEYGVTRNGEYISYGAFTWALCRGCGYDLRTGAAASPTADRDGDGVISLQEAYSETARYVRLLGADQTAQVWPENCGRFGVLR